MGVSGFVGRVRLKAGCKGVKAEPAPKSKTNINETVEPEVMKGISRKREIAEQETTMTDDIS